MHHRSLEGNMDRKALREAFEAYVSNYDLEDSNILLKYIHTGKVAENCETIARSLNLKDEEIDLAWEIGMLHDIGRFEQLRRFHTFFDAKSIDHAQFGADLLFKDGLFAQFDSAQEHAELIETAIRCHSLYRLPEHLSEREILFCQMIRDADKIDIYRANYETGMDKVYYVTMEEIRNSAITPEVYQVFCEGRAIPREIRKTVADNLVGHIALTFELVYPVSRKMAVEQGYLWKLLKTEFDNQETVETMRKIRERMEAWKQSGN